MAKHSNLAASRMRFANKPGKNIQKHKQNSGKNIQKHKNNSGKNIHKHKHKLPRNTNKGAQRHLTLGLQQSENKIELRMHKILEGNSLVETYFSVKIADQRTVHLTESSLIKMKNTNYS
jgi:hypothetical protein